MSTLVKRPRPVTLPKREHYRSPLLDLFPRRLTRGKVTVDSVDVSEARSMMSYMSHSPWMTSVPPGRYARLVIDGQVVMSDTRMEKHTNSRVINQSHGRVLVAGLGLGMVIQDMFARRFHRWGPVEHLTVVERDPDVIALVAPKHESPTVTVVQGDIDTWRPETGAKFDCIYFDIWPTITEDNLPQMARLHRSFAKYLNRDNPNAWMDSWCCKYLRARRRQDRY